MTAGYLEMTLAQLLGKSACSRGGSVVTRNVFNIKELLHSLVISAIAVEMEKCQRYIAHFLCVAVFDG